MSRAMMSAVIVSPVVPWVVASAGVLLVVLRMAPQVMAGLRVMENLTWPEVLGAMYGCVEQRSLLLVLRGTDGSALIVDPQALLLQLLLAAGPGLCVMAWGWWLSRLLRTSVASQETTA